MAKLIRKTFLGTVQKADGDEAPRIVFRASDSSLDRYNDRVFVGGMDLSAYEKNGVLMWAHRHDLPAIGTAKVWVEGEGADAVLYMEPSISDVTQLGKDVKAAVEAGVIKACSVGFSVKGDPKKNEHGGYDFHESELHEISICNVGANKQALRERALDGDDAEPEDDGMNAKLDQLFGRLDAVVTKLEEIQSAVEALSSKGSEDEEQPAEEPTEAPEKSTQSLSPLAKALLSALTNK